MAASLVGLPSFRPGSGDLDRWSRTNRAAFRVRMPALAALPRQKNSAKKKDNEWKRALQNEGKKRHGGNVHQAKKKAEWRKKKPVSKDVSGMLIADREEVLQEEEIVPSPAWKTFCSNSQGVWRGVGAVYSPETAAVEPVGLGKRNEYLYDCRIVSIVEGVPGKRSIDREVLWNLQNPHASKTQEKVQIQDDVIAEDMAAEEEDGSFEDDTGEDESFVEDSEEVVEKSAGGVNLEELTDADEDLEDLDNEDEDFEGEDEDFEDEDEDFDDNEEDFDDEKDLEGEEEESEDCDLEEEADEVEGSSAAPEEELEVYPIPELKAKHSYEGMKDVMEKERIDMEPGLVFFEDGAYSRGPKCLLRAKDDTSIARGYFYSPTYKIEHCLVRAGHKRVRICHTISVHDETDEVEVLRVSAFEEDWIGPVAEESFRTSSTPELQLLSQRSRLHPKDLVGTWKVFQISSSISEEVFSCKEFKRRRRMPVASSEQGATILWLPGDLYTYVHLTDTGILRIGVGWRLEEKSNLVIERDYNPDGLLLEVRTEAELLQSKSTR